MMDRSWSLREEIGAWIGRWYIFVLVFLIGGTLGWGSAWIFPPEYEARAPLFVAFNSDALFTSPDDFKNAQFEEATDLILSNSVLGELADADQNAEREQFSVQWRNAGRWELVVRDQNSNRAARVVAHWREIAFDQLSTALPHAFTLSQLDQEVNLTARSLSEAAQTLTRLEAIETGIHTWQAELEDTISSETRADLWAYSLEFSTPDNFPEEGAGQQTYLDWVEELMAVLEVKRGLLETEQATLQTRMDSLQTEWEMEKAASRGLSAYLVVEMGGDVEVEAIRSPGLLALVGGFVGVLGWIGFRLVRRSDNGGMGS